MENLDYVQPIMLVASDDEKLSPAEQEAELRRLQEEDSTLGAQVPSLTLEQYLLQAKAAESVNTFVSIHLKHFFP